ncbi:GtrA family protein [Cupriavidus nantongensis]|uniref:GtrA family protein n=1 Tax=Cupriavidus nantongensis TaxID=1796606 RepID=UPI00358EFCCE
MIRRQLIGFLIAGAIGFGVDAGVLYASLALGAGYYTGRLLSFLAAAFVTWRINRRFTFPTRNAEPPWREWLRYLSAMSAGGAINLLVYSIAVNHLAPAPWRPLLAVALGTGCGLVFNFLSAKLWVFRHRP